MVDRQSVQQKKDSLLAELAAVRADILNAAAALPEQKQNQVFLGIWGIKDLLAHLIGWDYTNIQASGEIRQDQLPEFYRHHDRDWRAYNSELVAKHRVEDFAELLSAVRVSHQKLVGYLQDLPAAEYYKDRGVRYKGYRVIIGRLLEAELKDEKVHLAQITEFASS